MRIPPHIATKINSDLVGIYLESVEETNDEDLVLVFDIGDDPDGVSVVPRKKFIEIISDISAWKPSRDTMARTAREACPGVSTAFWLVVIEPNGDVHTLALGCQLTVETRRRKNKSNDQQ